MAAPADLSKLRINRDAPPPTVRRAFGRNAIIFGLALVILGATAFVLKARAVPTVQVVTATAGGGGTAVGGATTVTANGYVVARTKASVSAKTAGRLAYLGVSEGSYVKRGNVIARLDNADLQAAVSQAQANVASADASLDGFSAFNVCSGRPISILEMATELCETRGDVLPLVTGQYRSGDVRHIVADPTRAAEALGFHAAVDPRDGLREFAYAPLRG